VIGGRAASSAIIPGRGVVAVGNPGSPLPLGWSWELLSDVAELGTGHTPSRKHPEYWGGDIAWIGIKDAGTHHSGVILDTIQHVTELGLANSSARMLPQNTVCLSRTASIGYVVIMGRPMATSQDFVTWTCCELLDPRFLAKALLAEGEDIRRFGEGSTHTTIYFPEVKAFHIGLPPVGEQQRIVAKIDSLSAKSKRARDHLDHIPRLVEKFKQAILAAAFRGELNASGQADAAVSWRRAKIADLASIIFDGPFGSNLKSSDYTTNGVRVVRLENIGHLRFIAEKDTYVSEDKYERLKRHTLEPDDILFSSFIAEEIRVCLFPSALPTLAINKADCFCIRVDPSLCTPKFLAYQLACHSTFDGLKESIHGATRPRISLSQLRTFDVVVPNLTAQAAIVRRIEHAFAWIDRLASETVSARKLADHLDRAVLAKAFRGELVPQDPDDEPASIMLERIKTERSAAPEKKNRKNVRVAAR
jgi:type I restriction enzyme S subunit